MKLFALMIVLVAIILLSLPSIRNLISLGLRLERGTTSRDVIWKNSLDLIQNNFWLGIGFGNFPYKYDPYYKNSWERGFSKQTPNAHNLLIDMFVRLGITGLILGVALYYLPLRAGIKAYKKMITPEDRGMLFGILGSLIALYGWSVFEAGGILGDGRLYSDIIFWIMYVMLLKVNKLYKNDASGIFFGVKTG
jgi:O-antigen ligase